MNTNWQYLQSVSLEFRLVAACSWLPQNAACQYGLVELLTSGALDWDAVEALVARHGLVGIFCLAMGRFGWVNVPEATKERLKGVRLNQVARNLGQVAELSGVCRICAESGIDLIPLKGVALSQELYGDPGTRNSGDLDILVRVEDVAKAGELLEGLGYRHALGFHGLGAKQQQHIIDTLHHHEYVNDVTGLHLELHWRSFLWTEEQVANLWEASSPAIACGAPVRHLSHADNILFLADHGARHCWQSLKWLSDLAMLLEKLSADEWQSLYDRAACFDLQRVLLQTALLLEQFYGIMPPAGIKSMIACDRMVARLADDAAMQLLASREELIGQVKRFAGPRNALMVRRLKPKTPLAALVSNVLIKPEDFLEFPVPDSLYWLYLPLRPYLWLRRHYLSDRTR